LDRIERTALVSMLINVGLVFLKLVLAVLSGSLALIADAWHSGSDVAASGLVWAGARISRGERRRDLAMVENVIGITIGVLILWAAYGIFRRVSQVASSDIRNLPVAIGGGLLAALVSYYAAQYKLHVGKETGSLSLTADGYHSRMDTLTTAAVVVGLMGHAIGIQLDRIAAAVVAIFVVESAIAILIAAVGGLREGRAGTPEGLARFLDTAPLRACRSWLESVGAARRWRGCFFAMRRRENRKRVAGALVVVVIVLWLLTGVYAVGPGRVGVVMRLGRALETAVPAGLHVKAPWPIDRVVRLEVPKVRRVEVGFRTRSDPRAVTQVAADFYATLWESRHVAGTYEKLPEEALRLTGDENIVDLNIVVFYRISEPFAYLFNTAQAEDLVRFTTESAVSTTAGSRAIDDMLTSDRADLERVLGGEIQRRLTDAKVGVEIIEVQLQDMHPPLEVVPAFRDVASAREDKSRIINEAVAYSNQTVPRARGEARKLVLEAEGYKEERTDRAVGDSERLLAMIEQYRHAKSVTRTRLQIETMERLLAGVDKYIVSPDVELDGYDLRVFDESLGTTAKLTD